jgi:hypothetical protein
MIAVFALLAAAALALSASTTTTATTITFQKAFADPSNDRCVSSTFVDGTVQPMQCYDKSLENDKLFSQELKQDCKDSKQGGADIKCSSSQTGFGTFDNTKP